MLVTVILTNVRRAFMDINCNELIEYVSLFFITATLVYISITIARHKTIKCWGQRILILSIQGFIVCCFVAARDKYYLSVQASFEEDMITGLFSLNSIQSKLCSIGGAVIAVSIIASILIKREQCRKKFFLVLSLTIILKTLLIEISRWMV